MGDPGVEWEERKECSPGEGITSNPHEWRCCYTPRGAQQLRLPCATAMQFNSLQGLKNSICVKPYQTRVLMPGAQHSPFPSDCQSIVFGLWLAWPDLTLERGGVGNTIIWCALSDQGQN